MHERGGADLMSAGILATGVLGLGSFACLAAAVAVWWRGGGTRASTLTMAVLGSSGVALLMAAMPLADSRLSWLAESLRNLLFLALVHHLFSVDGRDTAQSPVRPVIVALAAVEMMHLPLIVLSERYAAPAAWALISASASAFRMMFAIGMLVLIHNLHAGADARARARTGAFSAALVVAWGYELNFATVAYLAGHAPDVLQGLRGAAWTAVALLLWRACRFGATHRITPSRGAAFQSLSLFLIALYLLAMMLIERFAQDIGLDAGAIGNFALVLSAVATGALLASRSLRVRLRETLGRHLFGHRYDYRDEWLGLARRMSGGGDAPLEQRTVQALAAITESPGGLLLSPDADGVFTLSARWDWPTVEVPGEALGPMAAQALAREGRVVALDAAREDARDLPAWLVEEERAWALVPLVVEGRMEAAVVLARPAYSRALDGEDEELLRVAGQQLAVHLSEQAGQRRLIENARFDEFNRRIAFVMHDIKNLSSQLGLIVANAERHIEKPAFREDMLVTLGSAAQRLDKLLGRLSGYGAVDGERPELVEPAAIARTVAASYPDHPVEVGEGGDLRVRAGKGGIEQVLRHLVQNAIEASDAGLPVRIEFPVNKLHAGFTVIDSGKGMPPEFIRRELFAPFVSTKPNGFGIGAYEARETVRAMGGRMEVESREGLGSRFTVWLPRAELQQFYQAIDVAQRKEVA